MGENIFDVNEAFFVIDSNNLESVETKLYGYCITNDGGVIEDAALLDTRDLSGDGAYIYIKREQNKIIIKQDFIGSYGLYIYRDREYFALSNSFFMLEEYLRKSHKLTLNKEYADYFLIIALASNSYSQTMINEISELDRSATVEIDVNSREMEITNHDYQENTVAIDSKEGIEILDKWYHKWTNIIKNIKENTNNIQTDLSGGFDSRMTLNLFLGADIDLSEIFIHSVRDDLHTHKEDFEIASSISDYYGFKLNRWENISREGTNYTKEDMINSSFYTKLGCHKQMYFQYKKFKETRYRFTGGGGESIRDHWNMTKEEYLEDMINRAKNYTTDDVDLTESVSRIVNSTFDEIEEKYRGFGRMLDSNDMVYMLYMETRCRNHFGKMRLENYFANIRLFCPLLDSQLHMLKLNTKECDDKNLLMTVMFDRYNSKLLDFKFDSNRFIDADTIQYAKAINEKYSYTRTEDIIGNEAEKYEKSFVDGLSNEVTAINNERVAKEDINGLVKNLFISGGVNKTFEMLYGDKVYDKMFKKVETEKYFPFENAVVVISISKVLQDELSYNNMSGSTISDFIDNQLSSDVLPYNNDKNHTLRYHTYTGNYITARIDIKNRGTENNSIEILKVSDKSASVKKPSWFQKDAVGYVIESEKGRLELVFKCINSGELEICLRGRDVHDEDKTKHPYWIDYQSMSVNGEKLFDDVHPIWHDKPFKYKKEVNDNDVIKLEVEWTPHNPGMEA